MHGQTFGNETSGWETYSGPAQLQQVGRTANAMRNAAQDRATMAVPRARGSPKSRFPGWFPRYSNIAIPGQFPQRPTLDSP